MKEIWKDIFGYEGLYQVSNLGNVKSLKNNNNRKEKLLRLCNNGNGYLSVTLSKDNHIKKFYLHRLVYCTFFNVTYKTKLKVDHIDTNTLNNQLSNLRLCTQKENCNNTLTLQKIYRRQCILKDCYSNKEIKLFDSLTACANYLGTSVKNVCTYCSQNLIYHKKYRIEYV